jgi:hypothetical protein
VEPATQFLLRWPKQVEAKLMPDEVLHLRPAMTVYSKSLALA